MHKIGQTAAGNHVVELTPAEFKTLERALQPKASGPVAAEMNVKELADYVTLRLLKSHPGKKAKAVSFVENMFQFTGGIKPEQLDQLFAELAKQRIIQEKAGNIEYPSIPES